MRINANLEPAYLAPSSAQRPSARRQMPLYTGALDHELRPTRSGATELNLLGERLILQGSVNLLALLMVNICLTLCGSMLGLLNKFEV